MKDQTVPPVARPYALPADDEPPTDLELAFARLFAAAILKKIRAKAQSRGDGPECPGDDNDQRTPARLVR